MQRRNWTTLGGWAQLMLFTLVIAGLGALAIPVATPAATITGKHCTVEYTSLAEDYAQAFATIYDCAWEGYKSIFGIELLKTIRLSIKSDAPQTGLSNDGINRIVLELASERDLLPTSRRDFIGGLCRQAGLLSLNSGLDKPDGLADGVGAGWALYCGCLVVDYVYDTLGKSAWPAAYDYSTQGEAKLKQDCATANKDAELTAACTFYAIGKQFGHNRVGRAMRTALGRKPMGAEVIGIFAKSIDTLTKGKASAMIPDTVRKGRVVASGHTITFQEFPDPTKLLHYADGWIGYDDDSAEGQRSITDSGHAVKFHIEQGGLLRAIRLKGTRFGPPKSSSQFKLYVMSAQFKQLHKVSLPYAGFDQLSEELYWREFKLGGLKVPQDFYIVLDFSPSKTDGIYLGFDLDAFGHSYTTLPDQAVDAFMEGDWMIRVKVE